MRAGVGYSSLGHAQLSSALGDLKPGNAAFGIEKKKLTKIILQLKLLAVPQQCSAETMIHRHLQAVLECHTQLWSCTLFGSMECKTVSDPLLTCLHPTPRSACQHCSAQVCL